FYAGKLVWPADLTFSYPRWTISASDASAYVWLLATAALGVVIWRARRRVGRGVEVAAVFFLATLSPMLGFIMLWTFRYTFVADHYQYLACLGPLALAAAAMAGAFGWAARRTPLLKPVCCAVLLAILGALTWFQCGQYAGADTLWRATLAKNPGSWLAHNELGAIQLEQGKLDEAAGQFKMTLALHPGDEKAQNNLGAVWSRKGEAGEAIAEYQKALDLNPDYADAHNNLGHELLQRGQAGEAIAQFRLALSLQPHFANAHFNLGNALLQQGAFVEAVAHYRKALDLQPDFAEARNNLGHALFLQGEFLEAIAQFRKALDLQPDYPQARGNLGLALLRQGDFDGAMACLEKAWAGLGLACFNSGQIKEAEESWRKSLEINPAQPQIQNNLASVLATASDASLRDGPGAVALAEQANQANGGGNPIILYTLAAAYAEAGRFEEACATARKALAEAQAQKNDKLAGAVQEQLKLYEAGHPMRQTQ
ncbi:MAG: tetratricopeptide repeat protein, partial [Verrucomicrobiota bacterium]